jgi:Leucine-rich repeat (LRR) protein
MSVARRVIGQPDPRPRKQAAALDILPAHTNRSTAATMHHTRLIFLLAGLAVVVTGCHGYSYTLNNREVFSPPRLFSDYQLADRALQDCVQQAIEDQSITEPGQLKDLNCSKAGISNLAGIGVFPALVRLGLDGNALTSVAPLAALKQLELLQLRDNLLSGFEPALCGKPGRKLALAGNTAFRCEDMDRLRACGVELVDAPAHCPQ